VSQPEIQLAQIVSVPLEENAYVLWLKGRNECLVVDPGFEPEKIIHYLEEQGLVLSAILNTHGHFDHIAGNAVLKERWPDCRLVIGAAEARKLTDARANLSAELGLPGTSPPADVLVDDGQTFSAAGIELEVLAIPGHSAGHVVYLYRNHDPFVALVGDVIFAGSIGRTDFADGDYEALIEGIRSKLFTLPDSTVLLPGHGPSTTVGREKRENPYVRG
jgi:hydroxyacylglutathione hydrolase